MVSYVPFLRNVGELKTKPTQHAVSELRSTGINPDILVTRGEQPLDEPRRETLAKRCFLDNDAMFDDPDADSIYEVPLVLEKQGMTKKIFKHFGMEQKQPQLDEWKRFAFNILHPKKEVNIALVGKYVKHGGNAHRDVYVSVLEAIKHASGNLKVKTNVMAFDSTNFDPRELEKLEIDGMVVPQGWGSRGVEGKIAAIKYAREKGIPYLGLCFGMQMAVIEFARDVCKLDGANSEEVDAKTKFPVIHIMPDQKKYLEKHQYGGTIRLGAWPCRVKAGSLLEAAYKKYGVNPNELVIKDKDGDEREWIWERHRHRYEVNNGFREILEKKGLVISGVSPDGELVEAIELPRQTHPFFVGTQFHPEYKSRPLSPHPIFVAFVNAAVKRQDSIK
ncbi:MAG: CTP synthase [Firmicutes bacterium]|nr:CTP synthase [Bacillota bacterium]